MVAIDEEGQASFGLLERTLHKGGPIVFYAFDLLEQDGEDLRSLPVIELKARLTKRHEFIVVGWRTNEQGEDLRAFHLFEEVDGNLVYRGRVGSGITERQRPKFLGPLTLRPPAAAGLSQCAQDSVRDHGSFRKVPL